MDDTPTTFATCDATDALEGAARAIFDLIPHNGTMGSLRPAWDQAENSLHRDEARRYAHAAAPFFSRTPSPQADVTGTFQERVQPWMMACFGEMISGDREERNHRFLEEALELVQSTGCTAHEAHQLVDYVYGRDTGEPHQEVGGVMVTLAALCLANALDMHQCGETELARIWTKVEAIRAKQAAKPKHSPLPGPSATAERQP